MRIRFLLHAGVTVTAVIAVLLTGCGSHPAEDVEDWYSSGGEAQIKTLADDAARVNEVSMRTIDVQGTACQELLTHVANAEGLDPVPDELALNSWKKALTAFRHGSSECTAGAGGQDEPQVGRGIREVQTEGIPSLAATVSRIKTVIKAK
ncbi:hypothetical protein ACFCZ1_31995 [Streptomyces sp. NPDC056224]|uniref:hypothetical protein n=1 Tax=Streptomyces sp. NPDC056224 TaxID=3345750 RepID=UPI0035D6F69B